MSSGPAKPVAVFALLLAGWIAVYWLWNPSSGLPDPRISRGGTTPAASPEPDPALAATASQPVSEPAPATTTAPPAQLPLSTEKVTRLIPPQFRYVTVQKGDTTFAAIAKRELGSAKYASAVSQANPYLTPNKLIAGRTQVRIPLDPENIQGKVVEVEKTVTQPTPTPTPTTTKSSPAGQSYVVKPEDTLSSIAKRFYGKTGAWQKIYDANRDKIPSPERLKPGTTITIPAE